MTPLPPKPTEDEALQDAIVEVSRWLERSMDASEKRALQTVLNAAEDGVRDNRRALAKAVREKNKQIETLSAAQGRGNFTKTAEHRASLASALAGRAQPRAGEKSPQSKLSDDDCIAILQSGDPQVTLAKRFGVSTRLIRAVRSHKTRPHLAALREPSDG